MLRYLYTKGASSLRELSRSIKLSFAMLHTLFQRMRQQHLFEITGLDGTTTRSPCRGSAVNRPPNGC